LPDLYINKDCQTKTTHYENTTSNNESNDQVSHDPDDGV
jgi:hypothetical protein